VGATVEQLDLQGHLAAPDLADRGAHREVRDVGLETDGGRARRDQVSVAVDRGRRGPRGTLVVREHHHEGHHAGAAQGVRLDQRLVAGRGRNEVYGDGDLARVRQAVAVLLASRVEAGGL